MNIQELINVLLPLVEKHGNNVEVRIGDYIEAGPYLHQEVGGVWTGPLYNGGGNRYVILCASDADDWREEFTIEDENPPELPLIWKPPPPTTEENGND